MGARGDTKPIQINSPITSIFSASTSYKIQPGQGTTYVGDTHLSCIRQRYMASSFKPLSQADLYFSSASTNIDNVSRQLKQSSSTQSVSARLHSIKEDSAYVRSSAQNLKLPVVSNERCGSWYVPPDLKAGSAYFKSTDGHAGSWSFSLRRLNLHLLPLIGRHNGCIVVDSTRRGKCSCQKKSYSTSVQCLSFDCPL